MIERQKTIVEAQLNLNSSDITQIGCDIIVKINKLEQKLDYFNQISLFTFSFIQFL